MRYEHIVLDISTATCAELLTLCEMATDRHVEQPKLVQDELTNLANELRARLQRRDADPQCPRNKS